MGALPIAWQAMVGIAGAATLWLANHADALPWPHPAGTSLAGLLALVAVTRVAGDVGIALQRRLRYGVAGVAIAGGTWFAGAGVLLHRGDLVVLGALHLATAWLAAGGETDPAERRRGAVILAAAMAAVSLVTLGAHAAEAPTLPLALAGTAAAGGILLARARPLGFAIAGLAGAGAAVLAIRRIAGWVAAGRLPPDLAPTAPLAGATALVGGCALVVGLGIALPSLWRAAAPRASPGARRALVAVTLAAVIALAAALVLAFG